VVAPLAGLPLAAEAAAFQGGGVGHSRRAAGRQRSALAGVAQVVDGIRALSFDAVLRYVGKLPQPATGEVTELGARFAYRVSDALELSVTGAHLLDESHLAYAAPSGHELRRAVYAEARLSF